MQTHHNRRGSNGVGNGNAIIRGVDRDLLAGAPGFIPPSTGVKAPGRQNEQDKYSN